MKIKNLFTTGVLLVAAIAVSAQSPRKLDYGFGLAANASVVDVDASGNAYVAGTFSNTETFGSFTVSSGGQQDVYIVKIGPDGTILNAVSFGGDLDELVNAIKVDAGGSVLIGGNFSGATDFAPGGDTEFHEAFNDADGYLLKLTSDLELDWVTPVGGFGFDDVTGVAADASSNIFITGTFDTDADVNYVDGSVGLIGDHTSAFFVRINPDGSRGWEQVLSNDNEVFGTGATTDASGAPIFVGSYMGTIDLNFTAGGNQVTALSNRDIFMLKLNASNGNYVWGNSFGADGDGDDYSRSVATDPQNNIYVSGYFSGLGDFDPGPGVKTLTSASYQDMFVARYTASGSLSWAQSFGGTSDSGGTDIVATLTDVYVAGYFGQSIDFGGYELYDNDNSNGFILNLDNNGNYKWVEQLGGEDGNDNALDVVASGGNVYLIGSVGSSDNDLDPTCATLYVDYEVLFSYIIKIGTQPAECIVVTQQPVDKEVCAGETAELEIVATAPGITYQWMIYDSDGGFQELLDAPGYYSGTQTSKLTITTGPNGQGEGGYVVMMSTAVQSEFFSESVFVTVGPHEPYVFDPNVVNCGAGAITLTVQGGTDGEYRWYTTETGGSPIANENKGTYVTPVLTVTTSYWVAINNGVCEGPRTKITAWITACEQPPALKWAQGFGGPSTDGAGEIIMLNDGNILIPGAFIGTIDVDPGPDELLLTAADNLQDGFLLKMTPDRKLLWAKQFTGNTSSPSPSFVKEDPDGNIYMAGTITGNNTDFDPGAGTLNIAGTSGANNFPDAFIVKYDKDGNALWGKKMGNTPYFDGITGLEVDASAVYLSGYFWNTFTIDASTLTSAGGTDIFVMKLTPAGGITWIKQMGNSYANGNVQTDITNSLFLKGNDLYIGGVVRNAPLDVDPNAGVHTISPSFDNDAYILKWNTDGDFQSVFKYESVDGSTNITDLIVDANNNIYTSGNFVRTNDFDPGTGTFTMTSTGGISGDPASNAFICKHTSNGTLVWAKALYVSVLNDAFGGDMTVADNGDLIISGMYQGSVDFDPGPLEFIMTGQSLFLNSYLLKLNNAGEFNWAISLRRYDNQMSSSAGGGAHFVDANGDIYMDGSLSGRVDFDPQDCSSLVQAVGATDFYLWRLSFDVANICFDVMPSNLQVCAGDDLTLSALAVGAPGVTYQWQRQNPSTQLFENINDDANFQGTTTNTLTVKSKGGFGDGLYQVIASAPKAQDKTSDVAFIAYDGIKPEPPATMNAATCLTESALVLTASGGSDGNYRWYEIPVGGIASQDFMNSTFETPVLTASTTYFVSVTDGICESDRTSATATIDVGNTMPLTTGAQRCGPGSVTLSASGAVDGGYRWYTVDTGGQAIAGETNGSFTTPSLTSTTTYYVAIALPDCESQRSEAIAELDVVATPAVSGSTVCRDSTAPLQLTATVQEGIVNWYESDTDVTPLFTGTTFTTPALQTTTTYYVANTINDCESGRGAVTVTVNNCSTNQPPVITSTSQSTTVGGTLTIDLGPLLSDPDNNIDLTTLKIITQPASGAVATIVNGQLLIDYSGLNFAGEDQLTIEVCDLAGVCVQQVIHIVVASDMFVYNAVSPNGDGKNEVFFLEFVEAFETTRNNRVKIFNRWGDLVFDIENYNNTTNVFAGKNNNGDDLPSGTYFYRIEFKDGRKTETGYLSLKR